MPSFATLSMLATIAFSAFASASPIVPSVPGALSGVIPRASIYAPVDKVASGNVADVHKRDDCRSIAAVLAEVTAKVTPLCGQLHALTYDQISVDVVASITAEINTALSDAIVEVHAMVGVSLDVLLGAATGTAVLAVADLAAIVAALLCLIFNALGAVCIVAAAKLDVILYLLVGVGQTCCCLCFGIIVLVDGLLALLIPLVSSIVNIILQLKIQAFISLFALA